MSGRFVRASKYRHVFGQPTKREQCYDNLRISKNAWDTNLIKANPHYLAVNWEASGGGAFAVIPVNERGKLPERMPLFRGHTAAVLDTDWNPFNDNLIASASDDAKVFLWRVPEAFTLYSDAEEPADVSPVGRLTGHTRKVGHVLFNPSAANVLASSSGDYTIKIWDIEKGQAPLTLKHKDIVQSMSWSANGGLLVTTSRDKKLRIWDARQEKPVQENPGHPGAKNSRAVWMGDLDRIATTGFSRMSDRQLGLWDARNPKEPMGGFQILDSISGVCMPFWDDSTKCLYLAGKGDGNIRYFEYVNDKFEFLSEYKSSDPQRGIAFLPKRGVNVHENEVMRAYKTVNDSWIEPVSFIVPRKAEVFQEDIYPPTVGLKPAMSSGEWFSGKDGMPAKISMESIYDGASEPKEVASDYKPKTATPITSPPPTKSAHEPPKPVPAAEPEPARRGPPPEMKDNKASISAMASKFADKDQVPSDDEESSFEEIQKPVERPSVTAARQEVKTRGPEISKAPPSKSPEKASSPTKSQQPPLTGADSSSKLWSKPAQPSDSSAPTSPPSTSTTATNGPTPGGAAEGLRAQLQEMKDMHNRTLSMLESQQRMLGKQMDQIMFLSAEVETFKTRLQEQKSSREKDERIRRLELEVEELRSQQA